MLAAAAGDPMHAPPRTILIVEDERVVARDLQRTLTRLGYQVPDCAASGDEAIRLASERCPDLVLMDIRIKGDRDGIEVADVLRHRFDVALIYLTAYGDDATVARASKTEPHGYLLKPIRTDELRSAVEVALYKHEMERRQRERERWLSSALDTLAQAVIATDAGGRVAFLNPGAEAVTGWRAGDAVGRRIGELLDGPDVAAIEAAVAEALRTGAAVRIEPPARADAATPIVDGAGNPVGAVLVLRGDGAAAAARPAEIGDRLASLGSMAAGLAHRVASPLAATLANLQLAAAELRRHRDPGAAWLGELERVLHDAQAGAERVHRIIADLRVFSAADSGAADSADVARAVASALEATGAAVRARARVVVDLAEVPAVSVDEARLRQVLIHLLGNAADAIAPGRPADNEIRVTARSGRDGAVQIDVADTGAGMAAEVSQRVFDPFFTTKDDHAGGEGLGLSISHGIVRSVGGEIWVESRLGAGTVFHLSVPAAAPIEAAPPAPESATPGLRGKLLVIDDERLLLDVIGRVFEDQHDVVLCEEAKLALELLDGGARFDLIVSDLMMPAMTGMDLYEQLLARHPDQARRTIFVTGGVVTARAIDFLRAVPNHTVQKPFDLDRFCDLVNALLATWGPA